jgi:hypothetical protein
MRNLIALLAALALPAVAHAATLTVVPDKTTYLPGETVTLTILGDNEGETSTTYSLFGRLEYDPAMLDPVSTGPQVAAGPGWALAPLAQGDGFADAFDQAVFGLDTSTPNLPGQIGIVTLLVQGVGSFEVNWADSLSFFSITGARPAATINAIPEPSTAALLGLGVLALTASRRRRPA